MKFSLTNQAYPSQREEGLIARLVRSYRSDSDSDGDFIQAKKVKVEPKSLRQNIGMTTLQDSYMYVVMYCMYACEVRQTHLHWEKLGVSHRNVNLSGGDRFTGSSGKTSLDLSK